MKIGVILPIGERIGADVPFPYAYVREMALQEEQAGFDSIWAADHLLFRLPDACATLSISEVVEHRLE